MAVFLTILKWIGIVILAVLLSLLATLLYCLILPLGYGVKAEHKTGEAFSFSIRAWGFLHFWQVAMMEIDGEYQLAIFAFWGKLRLYPRKPKEKEETEDDLPNVLDEEDVADILEDKEVSLEDVRRDFSSGEETDNDKGVDTEQKSDIPQKEKQKKEKKKGGFSDFHKKIKDEHNRNAVRFFLEKILWLIKKTRPNILHADVDFSLGDPALTGMTTGILSLCPGCYGKKTRICPDFESEEIYANGWIEIKGIVFLMHIVYLIVSIFFSKEFKSIMKS